MHGLNLVTYSEEREEMSAKSKEHDDLKARFLQERSKVLLVFSPSSYSRAYESITIYREASTKQVLNLSNELKDCINGAPGQNSKHDFQT